MDEQTLRLAARDELRRHGPLAVDDLYDLLDPELVAGLDADDLADLLLDDWNEDTDTEADFIAWSLADDRLCDLDHLLDGAVLTHRPTAGDRAEGTVAIDPDLAVLWFNAGPDLPLVGGGELRPTQDGRVRVPADQWPDEDVLACTIRGGEVEVTGLDRTPDPDPDVLDALTAARHRVEDLRGTRADVTLLLIEALGDDPDLFARPQAPLGDLIAAARLRITGRGWVVGEDEEPDDDGDPYTHVDEDTEALVDHLVHDHHLAPDQSAAVVVLGRAVENAGHALVSSLEDRILTEVDDADELAPASLGDVVVDMAVDPSDPDGPLAALSHAAADGGPLAGHIATLLSDGPTAQAYLHDVVGPDQLMAMMSLTMLQAAPVPRDRRARANRHWLAGRLLEFVADDHTDAEREFRQALQADRDHGEATYALAIYKSDRGDAGAALGLLRQLRNNGGVPDLTEVLERFAAPGPMTAGRNEPCPCGSGRKHKVCCATSNGWPLDDRQPWLLLKQVLFAASAPAAGLLDDIADIAGDHPLDNVVLRALAFHEGGLISEFLRLRGPLLPPDELDLLHQYAEVRARALLVVEVTPGTGLVVLDHVTGERVELRDRSLSTSLQVDDLVLGWILPTPRGPEPAGAVLPVPEHARQSLLALVDDEPDAPEIAAWLAALMAPPTMKNREGHLLVLTELTFALDDVDAARAALVASDDLQDEGGDVFVHLLDIDGEELLGARVVMRDDELVVEVNSAERADRLRRLVARLLPDAELVDTEVTTLDDLRAGGAPRPEAPTSEGAGLEDLSEAEVEEMMDRVMREAEDRWVDQSIPALGGITPREAADDPTRRGDLQRLLRDFQSSEADWTGPGRPMSAARLRSLLDLPPP